MKGAEGKSARCSLPCLGMTHIPLSPSLWFGLGAGGVTFSPQGAGLTFSDSQTSKWAGKHVVQLKGIKLHFIDRKETKPCGSWTYNLRIRRQVQDPLRHCLSLLRWLKCPICFVNICPLTCIVTLPICCIVTLPICFVNTCTLTCIVTLPFIQLCLATLLILVAFISC